MTGLYKVMDKLAPEIETRVKIIAQLGKFDRAEGMFGYDLAVATRDKMQPGTLSCFVVFNSFCIYLRLAVCYFPTNGF